MIDHISTYAINYPATKQFYEASFAALGYTVQSEIVAKWNPEFPTQRMCAFGTKGKPSFWVIESKEKHTPLHVAFAADSRSQVDQFYTYALESGGRDKDNGQPKLRPVYHENYYCAYTIDPEGNSIEAVCHRPD